MAKAFFRVSRLVRRLVGSNHRFRDSSIPLGRTNQGVVGVDIDLSTLSKCCVMSSSLLRSCG